MTPARTEPDNASVLVMPGRPAVIVAAAEPPKRPVVAAAPDLAGAHRLLRALVDERPNDLVPVQLFENNVSAAVVKMGAPFVKILSQTPLRDAQLIRLTDKGSSVVAADGRHRQ